jgi:hypothetical protein
MIREERERKGWEKKRGGRDEGKRQKGEMGRREEVRRLEQFGQPNNTNVAPFRYV